MGRRSITASTAAFLLPLLLVLGAAGDDAASAPEQKDEQQEKPRIQKTHGIAVSADGSVLKRKEGGDFIEVPISSSDAPQYSDGVVTTRREQPPVVVQSQ